MPRHKTASDFEERFYDLIQDSLERLENGLATNTNLTEQTKRQAERTNGRVDKLEKEVFGKVKPSDLPPIYRDPKVISIVFNISLAILILIVAATKVDVGGLLP